ncbi:MAG: cobalamin-binding protein [candidate division Zixibacteria bacterium]|nr:cobalamin-binding protein [candidate division Zixibacteria bacterium]
MKVISLIASSTEIVCALGFESHLVGRSHECDYPESVSKLPICTEPKFQLDGTSYQIDERVKAILQEGLSVYRVDAGKLQELKPDIIITQAHCDVCAVSLADVEAAVSQIVGTFPKVVSLEPNSLEDIFADIRKVALALDCKTTGEMLVGGMEGKMKNISVKTQSITRRPAVACIEWIEPLMAAGNWMPTLVEMAGGENLFGEAGKHSPVMTWEQLYQRNPEILFISPCGFDIARTLQEMPKMTSLMGWSDVNAVKNGRVYIGDGNQYFNRPGPRVAESLEILAECFFPDGFYFGFEGKGWIKFTG